MAAEFLHSSRMPSSKFVTSAPELSDLAALLATSAAIALDTEFMRERTYRAQLCLVQVATDSHAACIDPLALDSLAGLTALMQADGPLKVLHAARQDLEVMEPLCGVLAPVFDTQIAAGLVGFPAQVGYAELVSTLLEVQLLKAHTRADWSRRPLSPQQIEYALDDVRYLLPTRDKLLEMLDQRGRLGWLDEELQTLASASHGVDPERAWLRLKGIAGLDEGRVALAQQLAAWRERRAIDKNRPRGWIIDDNVLREIIHRVPRSREQLASIREIPDAVVRNSGEELLAMIAACGLADPPLPLPRRERPDPQLTALVKRLADIAQQTAQELELAPELLATRRDLDELARTGASAALFSGWRGATLGPALRAAL